jgi:hypothetical protein
MDRWAKSKMQYSVKTAFYRCFRAISGVKKGLFRSSLTNFYQKVQKLTSRKSKTALDHRYIRAFSLCDGDFATIRKRSLWISLFTSAHSIRGPPSFQSSGRSSLTLAERPVHEMLRPQSARVRPRSLTTAACPYQHRLGPYRMQDKVPVAILSAACIFLREPSTLAIRNRPARARRYVWLLV